MAKKSTKSKQAVATLEQFTVGGNLDVGDVLSVVVSRAEQKYGQEIARCRDEIADLEEQKGNLRKEATKLAKKEAVEPHEQRRKDVLAAVKPLGGTAALSTSVDNRHGGRGGFSLDDDGMLTASLSVKSGGGGYSNTVSFELTVKPSKALLKLRADQEKLAEQIADSQREAVEWKRKLNNVPMLERQYRARIAETKLSQDKDGQELLKVLTADLDEQILALPSA